MDFWCNKNIKSPTKVQQNFLQWYIIIHHNAIFISKSNKISVNPQIPKECFGNNRNAPFVCAPWARSNGCKSRTRLGNEEVYS